MEAKVGVFGRGMASVKIQYFADGRPYGMFKARACQHGRAALLGEECSHSVSSLRGQQQLPSVFKAMEGCVIAHAQRCRVVRIQTSMALDVVMFASASQ